MEGPEKHRDSVSLLKYVTFDTSNSPKFQATSPLRPVGNYGDLADPRSYPEIAG